MKKLMIAAAIVCAAAISHASSLQWGSANFSYIADANGTRIQTAANYNTLLDGGKIVLVLLKDGTYDGAMSVIGGEGISGTEAAIVTSNPSSNKGKLSSTMKFTYGDSNPIKNGDVLGVMYQNADKVLSQLVYIDAEGKVGDKIAATYTVSGLDGSEVPDSWSGTFTFTTAGTSVSAMNNFTVQSVPEPTSGLLLLLGVAGLALRRRRA